MLRILQRSKVWYMDGTFKNNKRTFYSMSFGIIKWYSTYINQFGISIEFKILHLRYVEGEICNVFHLK